MIFTYFFFAADLVDEHRIIILLCTMDRIN